MMTSLESSAFSSPYAGFEYLETEAHYLSLAARIVVALRRGSSFVIVTGDPPPTALNLSQVLGAAAAWWYRVAGIVCGPEIGRDQLLPLPAPAAAMWTNGSAGRSALPLAPLFVFDDVARLSDDQIEDIYEALTCKNCGMVAGVLLARPADLTRLQGSKPRLLEDNRTARLRVDELGREEIATFIRRQLCPERRESPFTADTITAIADAADGDPALVNHLSRLMLTFAEAVEAETRRRPAAAVPLRNSLGAEIPSSVPEHSGRAATRQDEGGIPQQRQDVLGQPEPPPPSPSRARALRLRRRAAWRWQIGIASESRRRRASALTERGSLLPRAWCYLGSERRGEICGCDSAGHRQSDQISVRDRRQQ